MREVKRSKGLWPVAGVDARVVDVGEPTVKGSVEVVEALASEAGQELGLDGLKEPLDLAFGVVYQMHSVKANRSDFSG